MTTRILEAAEKYALGKYGDGSWTAQSEKLGARDFQAGAEWAIAEVLRELRTPQAPYDGAAVMKNRAVVADWLKSRFKGEK